MSDRERDVILQPADAAPAAGKSARSLPEYLKGRAAGALTALLLIQAALALLKAAAVIGIVIRHSGHAAVMPDLIPAVLLPVYILPPVMIGIGALRLRRGKAAGASMAAAGCGFTQALYFIPMVLSAILIIWYAASVIGQVTARNTAALLTVPGTVPVLIIGTVLVALLAIAAAVLVFSVPVRFYGAMREALKQVRGEMTGGGGHGRGFRVPKAKGIISLPIAIVLQTILFVLMIVMPGVGTLRLWLYFGGLTVYIGLLVTVRVLVLVCLGRFARAHERAGA